MSHVQKFRKKENFYKFFIGAVELIKLKYKEKFKQFKKVKPLGNIIVRNYYSLAEKTKKRLFFWEASITSKPQGILWSWYVKFLPKNWFQCLEIYLFFILKHISFNNFNSSYKV
jgi:hypothetical protein